MQECSRKSYYALKRGLRLETEGDATLFGSAFHKALEYWYALPTEARTWELDNKDAFETLSFGNNLGEPLEGPLEAVRQFMIKATPLLSLADGDKRHPAQGVKLLRAYFKHYANDRLAVMKDEQGPLIERSFSFKLAPNIEYFGTIDCILRNLDTGEIFVTDHKTTSQLGQQFFNRLKPNHQYTGYVMGAKIALGIETQQFMVNGIQTAKTKQEFARQITTRTEEDFKELTHAVQVAVIQHEASLETGIWPQTTPAPCSSYGGCAYLDICSAPESMREGMIRYKYGEETL